MKHQTLPRHEQIGDLCLGGYYGHHGITEVLSETEGAALWCQIIVLVGQWCA